MTQPSITLASGTTGDVTVATGISSASVTVGTDDLVAPITALGTPTTATALTGVKVTAQPTVKINNAASVTVAAATAASTSTAVEP